MSPMTNVGHDGKSMPKNPPEFPLCLRGECRDSRDGGGRCSNTKVGYDGEGEMPDNPCRG